MPITQVSAPCDICGSFYKREEFPKRTDKTEQQIQKELIDKLEADGWYVVKVIAASKNGVPDIIACNPIGKFVAFECKRPNKINTLTKLQEYNGQQIIKAGGHFVLWTGQEKIPEIRY